MLIVILPAPSHDYEYADSLHAEDHKLKDYSHPYAKMEHKFLIQHAIEYHSWNKSKVDRDVAINPLTGEVYPL